MFWPFPPPGGGDFVQIEKTKKPEEFKETGNISPKKQGGISTEGGNNFSGWPEYISLYLLRRECGLAKLPRIVLFTIFLKVP